MEKQTRVSKYKELREEMKEEVAINQQAHDSILDEDDDFLSFLPKEEKAKIDDTLMEPLTYETLDRESDDVLQALNQAKVNVGKEKYNTRLDILNKIKQDSDYVPAHSQQSESQSITQTDQSQKKMSLLERLAAMSPEEDAEELKRYEEEVSVEELMRKEKKRKSRQTQETVVVQPKPVIREEIVEDIPEDDEDDEVEEDGGKLVKVLNCVIIVFMIIFIVLVCLIVKQLLF